VVLSNVYVQKALKEKRLIITPQPSPSLPIETTKCPYDTTAVDLRLGDEVVELVPRDPHRTIDMSGGGFKNIADLQSVAHPITAERPYILKPGKFLLAKTHEEVTLPLDGKRPQLAARIEGKSSFARCGLLVHFTAPTIHAGFSGTITLEMANFGPFDLILKPRMYICQLIVEEVVGTPFRNDSSFQNQKRPGGQRK
jgi:dCTP deaminase